jgi:poly(A) polymerase
MILKKPSWRSLIQRKTNSMEIYDGNFLNKIPDEALQDLKLIHEIISKTGGKVYLIGGSVRDLVLNTTPKEYDLTTSLKPDEIKKHFKRVIDTGIKHGTVTILLKTNSYEITTFRRDVGYSDGRRPDKIIFGESLEEDLLRRDFTMNSLALEIDTGKVLDYHKGVLDIQNKIIKTIGNPMDRFNEDGLRPIRAIRFTSTLNFTIDEMTYHAVKNSKGMISKVSVERFHDELIKIFLSNNPKTALKELINNQIFDLFWSIGKIEKTNIDLDSLSLIPSEYLFLRCSVFFHLIIESKERLSLALKKLRFSNEMSKWIEHFFDLNKTISIQSSNLDYKKKLSNLLSTFDKSNYQKVSESIIYLLKTKGNPDLVKSVQKMYKEIEQFQYPIVKSDLKINGNDLISELPNLEKRKIGEYLNLAMLKVLDDPNHNSKEKLIEILKNSNI